MHPCDTMNSMSGKNNPCLPENPEDEWDKVLFGDDGSSSKQHRRTVMKHTGRAVAIIIAMVIVAALVFAGFRYIPGIVEDYRKRNAPPEDNSVKMSKEYTDGSGARNPAAGIKYSGPSTTTIVTVDHRSITVKGEKSAAVLSMPSLSADINAQQCELKSKAATCYFGSSKAGQTDIDLYAFRDAPSSSLLMTTEKPVKVKVQGAALAYAQPVSVGDQKDMRAVTIINRDQTGVMIIGKGIDGSITKNMTISPVAEPADGQQKKE